MASSIFPFDACAIVGRLGRQRKTFLASNRPTIGRMRE
jgi:hypothetical protein